MQKVIKKTPSSRGTFTIEAMNMITKRDAIDITYEGLKPYEFEKGTYPDARMSWIRLHGKKEHSGYYLNFRKYYNKYGEWPGNHLVIDTTVAYSFLRIKTDEKAKKELLEFTRSVADETGGVIAVDPKEGAIGKTGFGYTSEIPKSIPYDEMPRDEHYWLCTTIELNQKRYSDKIERARSIIEDKDGNRSSKYADIGAWERDFKELNPKEWNIPMEITHEKLLDFIEEIKEKCGFYVSEIDVTYLDVSLPEFNASMLPKKKIREPSRKELKERGFLEKKKGPYEIWLEYLQPQSQPEGTVHLFETTRW